MTNIRARMIAAAAVVALAPVFVIANPAAAAPTGPGLIAADTIGTSGDDPLPAAVTVTSAKISTTAITLRSDEGCVTKARLTATLSGPLPTEDVLFGAVGADVIVGGEYVTAALLENTGGNTWQGDLDLCGKGSVAGSYRLELYAAYVTGSTLEDIQLYQSNVKTLRFTVKRPSKVTVNAAPEPVRKGATVTTKGKLTSDGKVLKNTKVAIWFQADGSSAWTYQGSAKTNSKGLYTKTFKAARTGTWKAVAAGTSTRNEATASDKVKVKK